MSEAPFDAVATSFLEYERTVRGHVRYMVTQRHLQPLLPKKTLNVLDLYGGSGNDAAWLAAGGHNVTLLESSPIQRQYAQQRFEQLSVTDRRRLAIIEDEASLASGYDLVLCHGVAQYQKDPAGFIAKTAKLAAPGALFSVLEKGYFGGLGRAINEGRAEPEIRKYQLTQRITNHLGIEVCAFKPRQLREALEAADFEVCSWMGVRLITETDRRIISNVEPSELAGIIDGEFKAGSDPEQKSLGQMLHFVARKQP